MSRLLQTLGTIFSAFVLAACVSVNLSGGSSKKADNIIYSDPDTPFKSIKTESADVAWQSQQTGNTIAVLSECSTTNDVGLKVLEADALNALSGLKIISSKVGEFSGREGLQTMADGQVDGIPVRLEIIVFKKNNCNYTLSFVGRRSQFDKEHAQFKKFKEGFFAP